MLPSAKLLALATASLGLASLASAQFVDNFDGPTVNEWAHLTGDGYASMQVVPKDGYIRIQVDGTQDPYNVWWTFIKRDVSKWLDMEKLKDPAYELRVEARVRPSHAPRRVNFMINTQRTTDFHEHLREYELPNTSDWHVISMTTKNFDPQPGDMVNVQFCVTDWGTGRYHVDVDYYRADVVRRDEAGPDKGEPLVYHPPVPDVATFSQHVPVSHDSLVHTDFPEVNFNDWSVETAEGTARILTVDSKQSAILRWDFSSVRGQQAAAAGVLELTTHSVPKGGNYLAHFGEDLGIEFGKIRVIEILAGDPKWDQTTVTYKSLLAGGDAADVFNSQMVIDIDVAPKPGGKSYATLPRPVLQRLLDGRSHGLIIRPLGAISASVYSSEDPQGRGPKLHFSTKR